MDFIVIENYYETILEGSYVAVAKGKCDCAAPIDHPLVVLEQVVIVDENEIHTWASRYSKKDGVNQEGIGEDYDGILNPVESLDARYALVEFHISINKGKDTSDMTPAEYHSLMKWTSQLESELDDLTEKIINRI